MNASETRANHTLGKKLILDELFDLELYRSIRDKVSPSLRSMLDELIVVEERHYAFWQGFFKIQIKELNISRRMKLWSILLGVRIFGDTGASLVLEAIEVHGIRKYLDVWKRYQGTPIAEALRGILEDEFQHEDAVVSEVVERKIHPERVRDIFLGFNDGMVEILGAVVGFLAAFSDIGTILAASMTVAVAGALSMAAGAYASTSSEREVEQMEQEKEKFLGGGVSIEKGTRPLVSAITVGVAYLIGAIIPIAPILFNVATVWGPIIAASIFTILVSGFISFLSGMRTSRRIVMNLVIIAIAVSITYFIGVLARDFWGISV